jgi:hypothetical protein
VATNDMENLGRLLAVLPPAPDGWVRAAQELPRVTRELDQLVARAEADAALRAQVVADLSAALSAAGIEPTRRVVEDVRARLRDS